MDDRVNNGGARKGAGRKPKADEQQLVEKLSPLAPKAYKALEKSISENQGWAIKLFFEYMYGKPKQQLDVNTKVEQLRYTEEERKARILQLQKE